MTGWSEADLAARIATVWRESCAPAALPAFWNATLAFDVDEVLPSVEARTLVLHRRGVRFVTEAAARRLAASIPNARLTLLEGSAGVPYAGDAAAVVAAIGEFLGRPLAPGTAASGDVEIGAPDSPPPSTAVILFVDIADSTSLTERMGDAAFRASGRALDGQMRSAIRASGGTPVEGKVLGDGVMATFPSAAQAIDAAARCVTLSMEAALGLHVGVHAGDVIAEGDNVYGGAVNVAARICALSAPNEVLVSDVVRGLARTSAAVTFEDRGEHALKGVGDRLRIYAVRAPD